MMQQLPSTPTLLSKLFRYSNVVEPRTTDILDKKIIEKNNTVTCSKSVIVWGYHAVLEKGIIF